MMRVFKRILPLFYLAALLVALSACAALDVVANDASRAFGDVLEALPAAFSDEEGGWFLTAPDGAAKLQIQSQCVVLRVDAKPFIDAGLNVDERPEHNPDSLVFSTLGFDMLNMNVKASAKEQFASNLRPLRSKLGYHGAMDHYTLQIGEGAAFEWAKNLKKHSVSGADQEKDIVFVLDPEPLIAAGLDPEKVEGWSYAAVPMEQDGQMKEVWKLLKAFDLA
ncbi:MAG: hypothetical protein LBD02_04950 [Christensenellaceae bacterium]|nr:hypothetical protein [Christensenellaceae bacterium]